MYGCMDVCMDVWMYGCMYGWMYGCMDVWMYGCMDVWMYGCMDVWMYGWMDACMHDVCMYERQKLFEVAEKDHADLTWLSIP